MAETETRTSEEVGSQIEDLTKRASELVDGLGNTSSAEDVKAVQEEMQSLQSRVQPLLAERERMLTDESIKALTGQVTELSEVVQDLRTGYRMPNFPELGATNDAGKGLYSNGERSLFGDIARSWRSGKAGQEAAERLESELGGKAMTEGTESAGGYLVSPEKLGVLNLRVRQPVLYNVIPKVRVNTDKVEFVSVTGGLTAGWAAELAAKPAADMVFGTLEASIFTAAGLAVTSNQLLEDSSIDAFIKADLEKRVGIVAETGILSGTGTGQPLGILNTAGRQTEAYTDATPTVGELLVRIAAAAGKVIETHLAEPTHVVLHPTTWTKIITDADATGKFTFGHSSSDPQSRAAAEAFPERSILGYPVLLSGQMPRNLGAGTNETRVIVADFSESLILERTGLVVDKSEHVYFTSNQTVFRGERRLGFIAGRYPQSICTVEGTGLINTSF